MRRKQKEVLPEKIEAELSPLEKQQIQAEKGLLSRIGEAKRLGYISVTLAIRSELEKLNPSLAERIYNQPQKAPPPWYEKRGAALREEILKEMTQLYAEAHKKEFYNLIRRLSHIDKKVDGYSQKIKSQDDFL